MRIRLAVFAALVSATALMAQTYQPAVPGYRYVFPHDDFNHPDYQTEWWYFTGNVRAADGRRFGFELTFFRQAVSRQPVTSPWQVNDLYMAHLALSDISGGRFYHDERINRAGPGIAGVSEQTGTVWNGNWQARLDGQHEVLDAIDAHFSLHLNLVSAKQPVINGRDGVSQKAAGAGHASHYISRTRLLTTGTIQLDGKDYRVDGASWMDHEFFSEASDGGEVGWDWISVQFNDNTELMLYRLRHSDGRVDPYSSGTYVDANGNSMFLSSAQFTMSPAGAVWKSPVSGAVYPIAWNVTVPAIGLNVKVVTPLDDQELANSFLPSYWEGAIDVSGTKNGKDANGAGYLEMTGYAAAHGAQVAIP